MSFRFVQTGDDHFDEHSRFDECVRVHSAIAEKVEAERPDALLDGGDLYERASTPREREAVAAWLQRCAEVCPVVVTKGNHDRLRDCALLSRLKARHPIHVVEAARTVRIGSALIACMAWPERAGLKAAARESGESELDLERQALRAVLAGLGAELAQHDGPRIALGHFMCDGAATGSGQPLIGMAMNVSLADLALLNAHIVLMSHIHTPQDWEHGGVPMVYAGSSYRTSYGEREQKSVVVGGVTDNGNVHWERWATPCAGMFLVEDEWGSEESDPANNMWLAGLHGEPAREHCQGSEVRFRYWVQPDQREAARAAVAKVEAHFRQHGAVGVKIEERVREGGRRARAPEIAAATTLPDKLRAYWTARQTTPDDARATRLLNMATSLEV